MCNDGKPISEDQFREAMDRSVALLQATAAVGKAQAILRRAGICEIDGQLQAARDALDAQYSKAEPIIRRWREVGRG